VGTPPHPWNRLQKCKKGRFKKRGRRRQESLTDERVKKSQNKKKGDDGLVGRERKGGCHVITGEATVKGKKW